MMIGHVWTTFRFHLYSGVQRFTEILRTIIVIIRLKITYNTTFNIGIYMTLRIIKLKLGNKIRKVGKIGELNLYLKEEQKKK